MASIRGGGWMFLFLCSIDAIVLGNCCKFALIIFNFYVE